MNPIEEALAQAFEQQAPCAQSLFDADDIITGIGNKPCGGFVTDLMTLTNEQYKALDKAASDRDEAEIGRIVLEMLDNEAKRLREDYSDSIEAIWAHDERRRNREAVQDAFHAVGGAR
ncbi:MAG: hypothetical protein AAF578_00440 [Pseudomonadota bacterium]